MSESYKLIDGLPLTAAQSGIWVGQAILPESSIYNAAEYVEFKGRFCAESFKRASQFVLQNTQALNVSFELRAGALVHGVLDATTIASRRMESVDLSGSNSKQEAALAYMNQQLHRRLAMEAGENYRHALIKLADDHHIWFFCAHHIAADGYSFSMLIDTVLQQYQRVQDQGNSAPLSFDDYAVLAAEDKKYRQSKFFERDKTYWQTLMIDTAPARSFAQASVPLGAEKISTSATLSAQEFEPIETLAAQAETGWNSLLIALVGLLLYKHTGTTDTVFGMPVANRMGSKVANIPCNHMNIVPLAVHIDPSSTVLEFTQNIAAQVKAGRKHWRYRYEDLKTDLSTISPRDRLYGVLVNVMHFDGNPGLEACEVIPNSLSAGPVEDISFAFVKRQNGSVTFDLDANSEIYTKAELETLVKDFVRYVQDIHKLIHRKIIDHDYVTRNLNYWQKALSGYEPLALSTDCARSAQLDHQTENVTIELAEDCLTKLRAWADSQATTLPTILLSAWYVTLSKLTGQTDFVVGAIIDTDELNEPGSPAGQLESALMLRGQLSTTQSLPALVNHVEQTLADATEHKDVPFERLVDALDGATDATTHPIFQVAFAFKTSDRMAARKLPVTIDLSLNFSELDHAVIGHLNFQTHLFTAETVERIAAMYQLIIKQVAETPSIVLENICALSDQQRHTLLHTWNQTEAPYPQGHTLSQLFEAQVDRTPDQTALVFAGVELSYSELNERANQLAWKIRNAYQQQQGKPMSADTLIALYLDRGLDMVISILAVLKSGGAYVPLSPEYPADRISFILDDTNAPAVITQRHYLAHLDQQLTDLSTKPLLLAADDSHLLEELPTANLPEVSGPRNLAYVLYTSGTTGQPKGVMIEHESFVQSIYGFSEDFFNHNASFLSLTEYTFDIFGLELTVPLISGGCVVLSSAARFYEDLIAHQSRINAIQQTPSVLEMCLFQISDNETFDSIEVLVGGESCSRELQEKLARIFAGVRIVYGPTETCIWSSSVRNNSGPVHAIGRPCANEQLYVLDSSQQPVPIGAPGELHIGGASLARGYLNRTELTEERFIPNPFATEDDKAKGYTRLYKTGDLVRWLPDGSLDYLGRNDFQVKIRGFRIELGEIESALASHPHVAKAVVIDREKDGSKYLAAYVIFSGGQSVATADLLAHVSTSLPDYMVPSTVTELATIPVTLNGKLDRRALPEPEWQDEATYVAPRNDLESRLCAIWQDVLGLECVGIHDNFFRIGGDSISVVRMTAAINRELDIELPLAQFFEHKTIAGLAANMEQRGRILIPRRDLTEYPLSFAQERMLFIEHFDQGSSVYQIPYLVALDDGVNVAQLETALNTVVARHPIMKTVYQTDAAGQIRCQVLETRINIQNQQIDNDATFRETVTAHINQPFDLANEPSLRLHHYQVGEQQYLLMVWHHIAMDGWSGHIFMDELAEVLQAQTQSRVPKLPELDISYGDYAVWQRNYLQGEVREQQLRYWQQTLADYESLALPTDRPRPAHIDNRGSNFYFEFDSTLSGKLKALAQTQETTLYTVLLSGFYVAMAKLSGQSDIVIGSLTDNRHHAQTQSLIGMFVNSLVLRAQVDGSQNATALIAQVHQIVTQAKLHQDMPFEQLVEALDVARDTSRHPIFQVMFDVQHSVGSNIHPALPFTPVPLENEEYNPAKFDLSTILFSDQENIRGLMNFAVSLFDRATIERFSGIYQRVLEAFVLNPVQPVSAIDVLSDEERHTLLHRWNQTASPYAHDKTLHQLFEEQVLKTPENIALAFADIALTYAELNQRANQLAHVIRQTYQQKSNQRLPADTLIALYLNRRPEMIISILAVLKAGGAYVPLSPDYPAERTSFILADTAAPLIITEQQNLANLEQAIGDLKNLPTILLADDATLAASMPAENLTAISTSTDLAYVIYTSGTTGQPKGVMIEHHSVNNLVKTLIEHYPVHPSDVTLLVPNYIFDASVEEIFITLCVGAKLVLLPSDDILVQDKVQTVMDTHGVNRLEATPSWLLAMRDQLNWPAIQIIAGGEALPPSLHHASWHVLNTYGPTETTVTSHAFRITQETETATSIPIGRALDNYQSFVLDDNQQLVPVGAPGELYIGGVGLARGYLNRPQLTAERFIDNPFATEDSSANSNTRLYKTGDLVRWLPDGNLDYLGRNDFQVKIRGFRIELGEIESALASHSHVAQAVVIDWEKEGSKYLAAYVVFTTAGAADTEALLEHVSERLPEYMVPSTITALNAIPMTLNGKLDRKALPEPEWITKDNYVAPHNTLESQLCDIWQQVLGLERVGIHDNFFRIGGDSIVSIQLVSKLRQAGFNLQVKTIFDAPTVMQLARLLSQSSAEQSLMAEQRIMAEQGTLSGEFDLLPIQQLFFSNQLACPHHFNQAFMVQLASDISQSDIERALLALSERHDMLRANFVATETGYRQRYQINSPKDFVPLKFFNVSDATEVELNNELTQWQSQFDYHVGPLWQAGHLTGYADGRSRLFFAFHHLIIDAVSWRIIAEDMRLLLSGQTLPPKTSSYRQWVTATKAYARQQTGEASYWHNVTADIQALPAPGAFSQQTVSFSAELTTKLLHEANPGYHTEINDLLLASLALALAHTFERPVNHITLEGHGRELIDDSVDISETVGWFTTTYPVRLEAHTELSESIIHTKEMLRAIPNKGIGYGALHQAGELTGELPRVSFNYLGQLGGETEQHHQDWSIIADGCGRMVSAENENALLLNINGYVHSGILQFGIQSRLSASDTETFNAAFAKALQEVTSHATTQAKSGGTKTPSDFSVKDLSVNRLRELNARLRAGEEQNPADQNRGIEAIYPASSLQQGFIYHALSQPQDDAYRVQILLDYHHNFNAEQYQQAWSLASLRYPSLRTAFDWQGEVLQIITSGASIGAANFTFRDISNLAEEQRDAAIEEIQQQDRKLTFDLARPGLIRVTIIKQSDQLTTVMTTQHHCIVDGWSGPALLKTVHDFYNALERGQQPAIEVDTAYLDTQQYHLDHQQESDAYWKEEQASYSSVNDLSYLLSRPTDLTQIQAVDQPAKQLLTIQGEQYRRLKAVCHEQGVTLNVAIQFAWHKLLQCYTGDEQTIVGTTVSGRDVPVEGIEASVGLYINTLPLKVDWTTEGSIASVLQSIQKSIAAINSFSAQPLSSLQTNGQRLFHSLFVFENYPDATKGDSANGIENRLSFRYVVEKANYPISIISYEQNGSMGIQLGYGKTWLDDAQATRLLNQLENILAAIAHEPHQPHASLSMIDDTERHTLLRHWNETNTPYAHNKTLHQLFEKQVLATPENIALVFEHAELSYTELNYAELNKRANQLARVIRQTYQQKCDQPLPADTLVALYFDRSPEMIISILAVLKAGGAYVPLSPDYPAERTSFILGDTEAPLLLTQQHHLGDLDHPLSSLQNAPSVLAVDDLTLTAGLPTDNFASSSGPTDLAYVIYTSGTTGQPKGVMIEHHSVNNLVQALIEHYPVRRSDVTLLVPNYIFDASVEEIFITLCAGAKLVLLPQQDILAYHQVQTAIDQHAVSRLGATPNWLSTMHDHIQWPEMQIIAGGEALPPSLRHENWRVLNTYGPTETTITSHLFNVASEPKNQSASVPIGRSLPNYQSFVLDEMLNPVPLGAPGELYIGGAGLARGYLNRDELTADRFIRNPFADHDSESRLYKTGDLVRWLANGNLEYLGRNDLQVKIRGLRIELGEIENALVMHPAVAQAVVIDRDKDGNKYLAAYLVFATEEIITTEPLVEFLSERLPEYMVPATFTNIHSVPMTLNGKLDRNALPEPEWVTEDDYVAPRTELESQLCDIWQNVLGLERIGIHDNFFRVGGDSLKAVILNAAIRQQLNADIPLATLFNENSVARLSTYLKDAQQDSELLTHLTPQSTASEKLFMVHASGSGSEVYTSLAGSLCDTYNCFGIDNYNFTDNEPIGSLQKLAALYLEFLLTKVTLDEPIRLLGWSLGGLLSMEMAYQLEQRGAKDLKLFLIDTFVPTDTSRALSQQTDSAARKKQYRALLEQQGLDNSYIETALRARPFEQTLINGVLSGELLHSEVVLFKAGESDGRNDEVRDTLAKAPDNHVSAWVRKPLHKKLIVDRHHFNILTAESIIKAGILE